MLPPLSWRLRDSVSRQLETCSFGEAATLGAPLSSVLNPFRSFCLSVSGAVAPSAIGSSILSRNGFGEI
jgi:hypothetical protein